MARAALHKAGDAITDTTNDTQSEALGDVGTHLNHTTNATMKARPSAKYRYGRGCSPAER